jgi:tetratricopeptide (TPR) repeat protein
MKWLDKLRRKPSVEPKTSKELFDALAEAIEREDGRRFEALCRQHTDRIVESFPSWQKPGDALGNDPDTIQAHIQVLGHTAQYLANALERPEPWNMLTGGGDNPFVRWQRMQQEIMQRVRAFDPAGAVELARALLEDLEGFTGSGRNEQEELARGLLGQLLRQSGRPDQAEPHLRWTLERCRANGDAEAVGLYLRELHEADRDRGHPSRWLLELAAHAEQQGAPEEAARYRHLHARFPEGEPLLRMVVVIDGRHWELDQIGPDTLSIGTRADVLFERNRLTLAAASGWIARGREHGQRGAHEEAIACFVAAAEADPHDPESRYLHAFSFMHLDRPELALPLYDEVERLAPGWFHSRTWRSLAQRMLEGTLPHDAVIVIDALQDGGLNAEQQLQVASQAITRWPRVPELFLYRGYALEELGREAKGAWMAGLEVCEDVPSTRSRLLLALGRLREVLEIEGANLMAVSAAILQLRMKGDAVP